MDTSTDKKEMPLGSFFFLLFFAFSFINLLLNFAGSPLVKWIYLIQVFLTFVSLFFGKRENLIWIYILFSFFEGQGRVLWGYNIGFRLIFDILLVLMAIRDLARTRKVIDRDIIPNYLVVGIFLHFIWFILEVFNPNGPDLFGALATSKYYIFPFFLFFLFKSNKFDFSSSIFQRKLQDCVLIVLGLSVLVIFQASEGEELIFSISTYYQSLFSAYSRFVGNNYRPWGTSFLPGAMGVYFYSFVGLWLLYRPAVLYKGNVVKMSVTTFLKWGGFALMAYACFLGQVRSAMLKFGLIVILFTVFKFIGSRLKAKRAIMTILLSVSVACALPFLSVKESTSGESTALEKSIERWDGVLESGLTSHRGNLDFVLNFITDNVDFPFGFGLGMTQSFLPNYEARRRQHVDIPRGAFFHLDNLFAFLFLELGLGAFIYIFIIVAVLISLFSRMFTLLRWRSLTAFGVLCACCSTTLAMFVFNWGAVAVPFNPESFYFWLWSGIGFSTFYGEKKRRVEN